MLHILASGITDVFIIRSIRSTKHLRLHQGGVSHLSFEFREIKKVSLPKGEGELKGRKFGQGNTFEAIFVWSSVDYIFIKN